MCQVLCQAIHASSDLTFTILLRASSTITTPFRRVAVEKLVQGHTEVVEPRHKLRSI